MRNVWMAVVALSVLLLSNTALHAADDKAKDKPKEPEKDKGWNGVIVDKACSAKFKNDDQAGKEHTKSCALSEGCAKSGYGLITGEKFVAFDAKSSEKAKAYIEDKKHSMKVHITGKMSDDGKTLSVDEFQPQPKQKKTDKSEKKDGDKKASDSKETEKKDAEKKDSK